MKPKTRAKQTKKNKKIPQITKLILDRYTYQTNIEIAGGVGRIY
jgi:hypothetical protein